MVRAGLFGEEAVGGGGLDWGERSLAVAVGVCRVGVGRHVRPGEAPLLGGCLCVLGCCMVVV